MQIVAFRKEHISDAARLVAQSYARQLDHTPHLPHKYSRFKSIVPLLADLVKKVPGVAAIRSKTLVGFLLGRVLSNFLGSRSVYSPEYANAANPVEQRRVYWEMYKAIVSKWLANGCFTHVISVFAHAEETINALHWLGFGFQVVDAIRDIRPLKPPPLQLDVDIRRAKPVDAETTIVFATELQRHLAAAPTFLALTEIRSKKEEKKWLEDPNNCLLIAYQGAEPVGCFGLGPANPTAAYVIRDKKTVSLTRAIVREPLRRKGIGSLLLQSALQWAHSEGYVRCAVDFESQNTTAVPFWLRYFQPICYSLVRRVDHRVSWAHAKRDPGDIW